MPAVLQLFRLLDHSPAVSPPADLRLRHYAEANDVDVWLALRTAAFADSRIAVRAWTRDDFSREILSKPWWRPEALWFVELIDRSPPLPIGTAILARRGPTGADLPVIHWLAVLPAHRRRGIGRLLVNQLESLVWQSGHRQIALETHAAWTDAIAFYRALGYHDRNVVEDRKG